MAKSAFVAIVGRPSSGKSTLLNALCGAKVSIVSPVPQTTRNAVRGIINRDEGQLVFIDTPGFHLSEKKLNIKLKNVALSALGDADVVLYVLDSTREPGAEEEALALNFSVPSGSADTMHKVLHKKNGCRYKQKSTLRMRMWLERRNLSRSICQPRRLSGFRP